MPRFLLGPVSGEFARRNLADSRAAGECLCFGPGADIPVEPGDGWSDLQGRLPAEWRPECVVLWLAYTHIPPAVWDAPVPLVGLAADWGLLWHGYRHIAPLCDAVLADPPGAERFRADGFPWAYDANLAGLPGDYLNVPEAVAGDRDIDILFAGNLHPPVLRGRSAWVTRLAALADRYRVLIHPGLDGPELRDLLGRAKLVFAAGAEGETHLMAFRGPARGAVLVHPAADSQPAHWFVPDEECVGCDPEGLGPVVDRLLADESRRRRLAAAGRTRVQSYGFDALTRAGLDRVGRSDSTRARAAERLRDRRRPTLAARVWAAQSAGESSDDSLPSDLLSAGRFEAALIPQAPAAGVRLLVEAAGANRTARVALADLLLAHGRQADAAAAAHGVLADPRGELAPDELATPTGPGGFGLLRVEWERAGWQNAGDPTAEAAAKHRLVRWRAHAILAEVSGRVADAEAAVGLRPDLPSARVALADALDRVGRKSEAVRHYRDAAAAWPLDGRIARSLHRALTELGESADAAAVAEQRRRLAAAAPGLAPPEPWFVSPPAARPPTCVIPQPRDAFHAQFGRPDTRWAVTRFTPGDATHVVLTLVTANRPARVLEVGTADGAMTANLTFATAKEAVIFSLGILDAPAPGGAPEQDPEVPPRHEFGRHANHFGAGDKVFFVVADSRAYDFGRFGLLDLVYLDGGKDLDTALSDARRAYAALRPGGCLVWTGVGAPEPWVRVREAIDRAGFVEPVFHVEGTTVAYLLKAGPDGAVEGWVGACEPIPVAGITA